MLLGSGGARSVEKAVLDFVATRVREMQVRDATAWHSMGWYGTVQAVDVNAYGVVCVCGGDNSSLEVWEIILNLSVNRCDDSVSQRTFAQACVRYRDVPLVLPLVRVHSITTSTKGRS